MSKKFYITTPIYYPNADLHMGHAYTTTLCDVLARYHRLIGDDTRLLSGTDDHAFKVAQAAKKLNENPKVYVRRQGEKFKNLYSKLGVELDDFIQTSDETRHWPGAKEIWRRLNEKGDLEKRSYKGLYCIGCEAFKKAEDLIIGKCPDHNTVPEELKEENWFFKLSNYADKLKEIIDKDELKIRPESRKHEILAFIGRGLDDISFSRPVKGTPWGIPVPGDGTQVMYVWCDALTNYITALGFGTDNQADYEKFWPADVHMMGKDILRFHAAIWPAMLLSAEIPLPRSLFVHGFITSGGRKMSKSIGNVVDPLAIIDKYGVDALRYFLLREINPIEDGDFTLERFKEAYNANLANGLGNLASRIMKMAETHLTETQGETLNKLQGLPLEPEFKNLMEKYEIQKAMDHIWWYMGELDLEIQRTEPFKLVKTAPDEAKKLISGQVIKLYTIARMLNPILPATSEKIKDAVRVNKSFSMPLFPRLFA